MFNLAKNTINFILKLFMSFYIKHCFKISFDYSQKYVLVTKNLKRILVVIKMPLIRKEF